MSEINERQSLEMFIHGLRKSCSAAKELAVLDKGNGWDKVARNLADLLESGVTLFHSKPQSRLETLALTGIAQAESVH